MSGHYQRQLAHRDKVYNEMGYNKFMRGFARKMDYFHDHRYVIDRVCYAIGSQIGLVVTAAIVAISHTIIWAALLIPFLLCQLLYKAYFIYKS